MNAVRRFFFYGTLVHGSRNRMATAIHRRLVPLGPAFVIGRLFAIPDRGGWYPALVSGQEQVRGQLYAQLGAFSTADQARMDRYEECRPGDRAGSLYWRQTNLVTGPGGARTPAQVYRYDVRLPRNAIELEGVDFGTWLSSGDRPGFRSAGDRRGIALAAC